MKTGQKKYHVLTWGCQMNEHDSEVISGVLEELGYQYTPFEDNADVIVLNTCCVRESAERKVYGRIAALKPLKTKNPNLILAVTGCMVQQPHVCQYINKKMPYVDLVFGIHNVDRLEELINDAKCADSPIIEVGESTDIKEHLPIKRNENIRGWVTITYGCNNYCSYCIVPYVRGREKSRRAEDILREIQDLAEKGFLEIYLLGQNVNSYGKDLKDSITFPELLYKVNSINGIERIRFITSHPKDLSDELIYAMRDCDKVCEHIHLPVQSGSNRVLKNMNRKYTRESYLHLIEKLRREIPHIAITTDIIVGFPGETKEDFKDTIDLIKQAEFDSAFTFMYSKRKGTAAAEMENQVEPEVIKERLNRLMKVQQDITRKKNMALKNKILEILVEGKSKSNEDRLAGRSRTMKLVNFEGPDELIGKLVNVKITEPRTWSLNGELV